MLRTGLAITGIVIVAIVAINLIFTSDRERVEEEMERLIEVAERGGEEAVAEILDALADDYRGSGWFARESLERRLRQVLVPAARLSELRHGNFEPVIRGEEILIPIVSLRGTIRGSDQQVILSIWFGFRDDRWKIVDVTRWRMGSD